LVRTICPACRTSYYPPAELLQMLRYQGDVRNQFQRGEGCRQCYDTGSKGRIGIYEVLWASRELRELIARDADLETLRRRHLEQGGTTLLQEGIRLAEEGKASLDEVVRVAFSD
jgi:type II secretory ATPase GspE/PulE/Tfp pilus assembly ATPase PilB-like protein